jgi:vesicular inhibitory amino acid transporter
MAWHNVMGITPLAREVVSLLPPSCTSRSTSSHDFLIFNGDNLHKLVPAVSFCLGALHVGGKQAFVGVAMLVVLSTVWFNSLSLLAYVGVGGALVSFVLIIIVLWVEVFVGVRFHKRGRLGHYASVPITMSLYLFCFNGHVVFLMIYMGLKDIKRFPMVR